MKYAVITGSTKGIGKATAKALLDKGYYTILNYAHDESSAEKLEEELNSEYEGKYSIVKADMSTLEGANGFADKILEITKEINVVIFSAGGTVKEKWGEYGFDQWLRVFNINLNMPVMLLQRLDKYLANDGRVIFLSSVMSKYPHSSSVPYSVSKSAVNSLVQNLVKEYGHRNITINAVMTGFTNTSMIQRTKEHTERIYDKIALHRFAEPEEIARFISHIIEDGYITGALLDINGGYCYR